MPETIICAIMFIPALIGVIAIAQELMLIFVTPKKMSPPVLIIPFSSEDEEVEFILKSAGIRARMLGHRYCSRVVAVDMSRSYYNNEICLKSFNDMDYIEVCNYDELLHLIESEGKNKDESNTKR